MKITSFLLIAVLVMVLVLGVTPTVAAKGKPGGGGEKPPKDNPPPPSDSAIAYVAGYNFSRQDLMLMDEDGANQTLLYAGDKSVARTLPSWSPDGTHLAFVSSGPESGLYTIDIASRDVFWVTAFVAGSVSGRYFGSPAWAPQPILGPGWVAYSRDSSSSLEDAGDLFLINVFTGQEFQLTNTPDFFELAPSWSPDATQLVVHVRRKDYEADDLWVYDVVVDDQKGTIGIVPAFNLTPDGAPFQNVRVRFPAWAKTSDNRVAFAVDTPEGPDNIWTVEWTNETLFYTQITDEPELNQHSPTWSSNDAFIAFVVSLTQHDDGIYRIDAGGFGDPQLLAVPSGNTFNLSLPDWRR